MDLSVYLERDSDTLAGATRVRGTRLSVAFILGLLEQGWSEQQIRSEYPQITQDALQAVFAFARKSLETERLIPLAS
jgi:uncharacterized protein (DUF433 family)